MKKPKLKRYRLRINPEKGSTVDFISQVESPAIEVGFLKLEQQNSTQTAVEGNMDIYGYQTRFFHMCPGAQVTFTQMVTDAGTQDRDGVIGMIRSAAQVADNVFRIESEVISSGMATPEQMNEATLLVDDFKDVAREIGEITGKTYPVDYMDGHLEVISEYLGEALADFVDACWEGYEPVGFKILDGQRVPNCVPIKEEMQSFSDYPKAARENAARGIKLNEEISNRCATQVGKVRAQQIADGEPLSIDTIKRTYSFLSRAKTYYNPSDTEACGTISYLLWGGDEMLRWTESRINREEMQKANDDKMELFGPVLIPDLPIYRHSETMGEYEIVFKKEDIKEIAMNFMRSGYQNNVNLDHSEKMADSFVFESFVSDDMTPNPKPFEQLPLGTWFVKMKVNNEKLWSEIKSGKRNGFSIEGIFEYMVEEFERAHTKTENRTTKTITEKEKTNLEKMIKDLFRKIFTELSQELDENAEGLSDYQMVASSDYKIEARQVGQKVEVADQEGNLVPAPDGAYEFEDGFKFMVKDGVISEMEGSMPEEEPMAKDKKKMYMDALAEYPWDQCMMDMAEEGYDEETAKRICGSIKWQNMDETPATPEASAELASVKEEFELLKSQFEELKSMQISKEELSASISELKDEFKLVFEKFAKIPAEPSKTAKPLQRDTDKQRFEAFLSTVRKPKN
jgi:hypothetical protein